MLSIILILFSILLLSEILDLRDSAFLADFFPWFTMVADMALGPLIWFLIVYAYDENRSLQTKDLLHAVPIVLAILFTMNYANHSGEHHSMWGSSISDQMALFAGFKILYFGWYILEFHRQNHSDRKIRVELKSFIRILINAFTVLISGVFLFFILMYFNVPLFTEADYISGILVTVFVYLVTTLVIIRSQLFFGSALSLTKYGHSRLKENELSELAVILDESMISDKLYLEEDITLAKVAEQLGTSANILSQVINGTLDKNFNELVNEYRLEEVKKRLLDPEQDNMKILALAFESGFRSKASFNRIFKQDTGLTPVEFRKKYRSHP